MSEHPIADEVYRRLRQLESEHRLMRETLAALHAGHDVEALAAENARLRERLARVNGHAHYENWFADLIGTRIPTPNTWPFTTWTTGTPWGDKAAFGLQDAEHVFAEHLLERLETDGIEGAIVEFGTYYGHWVQVLAETLERRGWSREIWGFDSFEGLPEPQQHLDGGIWHQGQYSAPFDEVQARLRVADRPWLRLVKGWFSDTLVAEPATGIERIAYARIDGDLYASCVDCLRYLTPRLVKGAILVFDDWQFDPGVGEPRAFGEWMAANPGWKFEFLGMNLWAHLYLRVTERP
jgi:hypothetical protein